MRISVIQFVITFLFLMSFLTGCTSNQSDQTQLPPSKLDFTERIPETLSKSIIFEQEGWCLWDPHMIKTEDGTCHLLYSRWPEKLGFEAWVTHAEIARATSNNPTGPFVFQGTVLGHRGVDHWDGHSTYNTCIIHYKDKYYLYYTGNHGPKEWKEDRKVKDFSEEWWYHRNNQRIGVTVADHPDGPWKRFDEPLIDVGSGFGQDIIAVPNVVVRPDGKIMLYYKTLAPGPGHFGGGVFHYVATGDDPLGPFTRYPEPMVDKNKVLKDPDKHFNFHIDDHFEWFQDDRYYAIVKDHDAPFMTAFGRSLLLFESPDGYRWKPSEHILVKDFSINWDDWTRQTFERLEMPKILFEGGHPRILSLAALPSGSQKSFIVNIPLSEPVIVKNTESDKLDSAAVTGPVYLPEISSDYVHVYKPEGDIFPGPDAPELQAGQYYQDWVPNDHCLIKGADNRWHMFGITHPKTSMNNPHAGEYLSFHAIAPEGDLKTVLQKHAWKDVPKVLPPSERPGESLANHAPFIVKTEAQYMMIYGPTPFRYAVSNDLMNWKPMGELSFSGIPPKGRDPSILIYGDKYILYFCGSQTYNVQASTSSDLLHWSEPTVVYQGKQKHHPESPSVVSFKNKFYLFWCLWNQAAWEENKPGYKPYNDQTFVFVSDDPLDFKDRRAITGLVSHAPEVIQDSEGNWYISSVERPNRGVSIAPLIWVKR